MIGLPLALVLGHLMRGELFGIGLFDPPSIGLATIALGSSGAIAAYLPAIRAMRVPPLEAIHTE
jgi:ABC-type antimicrobial peptide transport system permease subunit